MPKTPIIIFAVLFSFFGGITAAQTMNMPPVATAAFGQSSILLNDTTTLTFTISNPPRNLVSLTGIGFTDTLPAGLMVAQGGVTGSCSSGTATAVAGSSVITVAGVSLAVGSTCVLTVNVTGVSLGTWVNSFTVNSNEGGASSEVDSTLVVTTLAVPTLSIAFVPSVIPDNGITTLTLTITNTNAQAISQVSVFQSVLPAGLVFANPTHAASSCGGQVGATAGGTALTFDATNFAGNSTCVITVSVTGSVPGKFTFSAFLVTSAGSSASSATGSLTVTSMTSSPGPQNFQEVAMFRDQDGHGLFVFDVNRNYTWDANDKTAFFGSPGDFPVAGDWFGTGIVTAGVFHCLGLTTCQWMIDANNNGTWDGVDGGDALWNFGQPGDIPVVGDWTGDGISKVGVMRCNVNPCLWVLDAGNKHVLDATTAKTANFGTTGDFPVVNNWGGTNGPDQIGVFRGGQWIVDTNGDGTFDAGDTIYQYGTGGDIPIVGNWNGSGKRRIGVFRPSQGIVILNVSGSNTWAGPPADLIGFFGATGDLPVVGFWTISF